jgi:hypothetical protein
MTQFHGSKGVLYIDDQAGTCRDMTGDTTSIGFSRTKNNPESTTMGLNTVARIDGLRDASLDVSAIFDSGGADAVVGLLDDMYAGSLVARAQYLPGGSVTGEPIYTASMRLSSYAHNEPVDGIVTTTYSLAIAAGSVTAACAA